MPSLEVYIVVPLLYLHHVTLSLLLSIHRVIQVIFIQYHAYNHFQALWLQCHADLS